MSIEGDAKNHLGSWEQAVEWFRRAIEANRNYPTVYFNLAAALVLLGRLAAPLRSLMHDGSTNWTVSRKVWHSPSRVMRSSG
jgi:tetratricopeptide (TPR) repeat protein